MLCNHLLQQPCMCAKTAEVSSPVATCKKQFWGHMSHCQILHCGREEQSHCNGIPFIPKVLQGNQHHRVVNSIKACREFSEFSLEISNFPRKYNPLGTCKCMQLSCHYSFLVWACAFCNTRIISSSCPARTTSWRGNLTLVLLHWVTTWNLAS